MPGASHRCLLCFSLALCSAASAQPAHRHATEHAHQHGVAQLEIVLDNNQLQIMFAATGADIAGFEGAARDSEQSALVRQALARISAADVLFKFEPANACRATQPAMIEHELMPEPVRRADRVVRSDRATDRASDHNDWNASYSFVCDTEPQGLTVELFDAFPALQRIAVQAIIQSSQFAVELTPAQRRVRLN